MLGCDTLGCSSCGSSIATQKQETEFDDNSDCSDSSHREDVQLLMCNITQKPYETTGETSNIDSETMLLNGDTNDHLTPKLSAFRTPVSVLASLR